MCGCGQATPTPQPTPTIASAVETIEEPPATATVAAEEPTAEATAETPVEQATETPVAEPTATPVETAEWAADGVIQSGEYAQETQVGSVRVLWSNDADYLYLAVEGPTSGWIAVGLRPINRMEGANFLIGTVAGVETTVWDAYGTAPTGATHPADEELGGTNDIVTFGGSEQDGVTRVEFQIPLTTDDEYDRPLEPGNTYPMIVALGASDDYNARHTFRGSGQIALQPAP
jgi:hypothetical protein